MPLSFASGKTTPDIKVVVCYDKSKARCCCAFHQLSEAAALVTAKPSETGVGRTPAAFEPGDLNRSHTGALTPDQKVSPKFGSRGSGPRAFTMQPKPEFKTATLIPSRPEHP